MTPPSIYACPECAETFIGQARYAEHLKWHDELKAKRAAKKVEPSTTELLGITKSPTVEDDKFSRPKLEEVLSKEGQRIPIPVIIPDSSPTPIELSYKYTGQCPTCRSEVTTVEIQLPDKNALTAFCISCNKTLDQQLLIPIKDQITK